MDVPRMTGKYRGKLLSMYDDPSVTVIPRAIPLRNCGMKPKIHKLFHNDGAQVISIVHIITRITWIVLMS